MKITAAVRKRFPRVEVQGYVKAGTPAAYEMMGPARFSDVSCIVCGAKITNVYETNYGPMGGDCLASLTGDDSTRKAVQQLYEKLRYLDKNAPLEVEASTDALSQSKATCALSGFRGRSASTSTPGSPSIATGGPLLF